MHMNVTMQFNQRSSARTSSVIYGKILYATHNQAAAAQKRQQQQQKRISTVRLLVTGTGTATTEPAQGHKVIALRADKTTRSRDTGNKIDM
jgi:hypothetical protein